MHPTRPPQAPLPESGIRPLFLHKQAPAPSQESDFPERQAGFPPPYNTHKPADCRLQHDPGCFPLKVPRLQALSFLSASLYGF